MARASRPSKKLPAFDPSELSDLIFSPAVGRGVGSHLLKTVEPTPAPAPSNSDLPSNNNLVYASTVDTSGLTPVANPFLSTVDNDVVATEVEFGDSLPSDFEAEALIGTTQKASALGVAIDPYMSTVAMYNSVNETGEEALEPETQAHLSTVDRSPVADDASTSPSNVSTVDRNELSAPPSTLPQQQDVRSEPLSERATKSPHQPSVAGATAEHQPDLTTVDIPNQSAVADVDVTAALGRRTLKIWVTEQGELVPQGRVKRIGPAQDVLNSAEESVYDTLWATRVVAGSGDEHSKLVQAGYHFLAKKTRLSKKTIQRIVDKLIQKGFIEIKERADIYARTSTIYRVFSYTAVKERQRQKNRFYVAKIGPGFTYAYEHVPEHLSTVDTSQLTREVSSSLSTEGKRTTVTVVPRNLSTVVRPTTTEVGRNVLDKTSSSGVYEALNEYGPADDDAVDRLVQRCKQVTADCTEQEIVHFIHQKGTLIRGKGSEIYSPIGFLVTAVPKCFSGESFRLYREEQRRRREAEEAAERQRQQELEEWRREQEERLADPSVPEEDKRLIRECLGV